MTVIHLPPVEKPAPPAAEPLLRLPPVTTILIIALVVIHASAALAAQIWDNGVWLAIYTQFGFMPLSLAQGSYWAVVTLLSAGFLHGGWLHLGVNVAMLTACGGGVERLLGPKWLLILLIGGIIIGNLTFFAFDPHSVGPLIGASGGISALFGACMLLLGPVNRRQIFAFLGIFIAISVLQTLMGGPGGESIAGAAHIGGFAYGLCVALWLRSRLSQSI
ncbi:MAG: rhomboid family intramembrane serine protease [Pseudomonadota bacterium]